MPLVTASGQPLTRERQLSETDAQVLRAYKQVLAAHGYKEALWCAVCEEHDDAPGCAASVTASRIAIQCRHQRLCSSGRTY